MKNVLTKYQTLQSAFKMQLNLGGLRGVMVSQLDYQAIIAFEFNSQWMFNSYSLAPN